VDYRVVDIDSRPLPSKAGWFGDAEAPLDPGDASTGSYLNRALVVRRGTLAFPVTIQLVTADGRTSDHRWDGTGSFREIVEPSTSELVSARVDPELRVPLDDDLCNNALTRMPGSRFRLWERVVAGAQWLLSVLGP
jgi:hypothetical protein